MTGEKPSQGTQRAGRTGWALTLLPLNAGLQGFSTMVPLYILSLGGTVVDVGLITMAYNLVIIPSSILWGRLTDLMARRKLFFFVTCAGSTLTFLLMFLLPYLPALAVLYSVLGFLISANSAATNLLVMETSEKQNWMSSFSRLNLIASVGSVVGLAVGSVWTTILPLRAFLLFCSGAAAFSIALTYTRIREPKVTLETTQLAGHSSSYLARMYHGMTSMRGHLLLSLPSPRGVIAFVRSTKAGPASGRSLLFLSMFLFMVSTALLNTSFAPFLSEYGVLYNEIFFVSLVNLTLQIGVYRRVSEIIRRFGGFRLASYVVVVRAALYMVFAVSALAFHGATLFVVAVVFYGLIGVVYAIWYSATSVTLMSILGEGPGNVLGGYAALGAFGTVVGSLFTGYISYYQGYSTTFTTAALVMLVSFFVLEASLKALGYARSRSDAPAPAGGSS